MNLEKFKLNTYSLLFQFADNKNLIILSLIIALFFFLSISSNRKDQLKIFSVVIMTALSAFIGARILHVIIERPELLKTPELIFTRFDGMTFNGSLIFGFLVFYSGIKLFFKKDSHLYWDTAALVSSISYGILRIGCFASGCCWGKISNVPWFVKYTHSHVMPWHGIPVHPVQLYDSLLGFTIFVLLLNLKSKYPNLKGHLFSVFLLTYSVGRFFTEFYRGDSFRGSDIFAGFSTSQTVSIIILITLLIKYKRHFFMQIKRIDLKAAIVLFTAILAGCLPRAPEVNEFKSFSKIQKLEVYQTYKSLRNANEKNVLFIAADDNIQKGFASNLKAVYKTETPPQIEDLSFWLYLKDMKNIYKTIVRIPKENVGYKSFTSAIDYLESLEKPYDIILLTHGFPNNLSSGKGYFFSIRELELLKGKLHNLNLVMLQSCYGKTLSNGFREAGARNVISYPALNTNFFFYGVFLKYYYNDKPVEEAYQLAVDNYDFWMTSEMGNRYALSALTNYYKKEIKDIKDGTILPNQLSKTSYELILPFLNPDNKSTLSTEYVIQKLTPPLLD